MSAPPLFPPPTSPPPALPPRAERPWLPGVTNTLLFVLVFCLAATVDVRDAWRRSRQLGRGIGAALLCQFVLLPLLGFVALTLFPQSPATAIALLVVTTSPGGSTTSLPRPMRSRTHAK